MASSLCLDRSALRHDAPHRKLPRYVMASAVCSVGGFLFGMDTGIIGPVTTMKTFGSSLGHLSPIVQGLVVSAILLPAAATSFVAGYTADLLGRTRAIAIGSLIFGIGAAIEAGAVHIGMFVAGRIIAGIGEGLYLGTIVVYICEISPAKRRGALATAPQLLVCLGIMVGFFTCYGTTSSDSNLSWKLPFILLAGMSASFALMVLFLPASPRWLVLRCHNRAEVEAAWQKLQVPEEERGAHELENEEKNVASILDLVKPENRFTFFLGLFLMGMQQLSGIDGVLYYAPLMFRQTGIVSTDNAFLVSGVSAIVMFLITIPATVWADGWSRRASTIGGGLAMAVLMFLIGALYAFGSVLSNAAGRWIVVVAIYLFILIYSASWAVGIKVYAAEIQPPRTRASATSVAFGVNWITNFLVALVTPLLLDTTMYGAYFLFGGCTLVTAVVCWRLMPETRGVRLGEMHAAISRRRGAMPTTQL